MTTTIEQWAQINRTAMTGSPYMAKQAGSMGDCEGRQMIALTLPYPPSTNRMWRNMRGRMVLSAEGRAYKKNVGWLAKVAGVALMVDCAVKVTYTLHPKATKKGKASGTRIDLGNCEKVASDALNGIAWHDDKQLVDIHLTIGAPMPNGGLTVRAMREEI